MCGRGCATLIPMALTSLMCPCITMRTPLSTVAIIFSGGRGHKVQLTRKAAVEALGSIVGMGVCHRSDDSGHDAERKIGVITQARLIGKRIVVRGILYAKDCARDIEQLRKGKFGMSYEIGDAHVPDLRADIWILDKIHFTGAAVILAEKCAYRNTRLWIAKKSAE